MGYPRKLSTKRAEHFEVQFLFKLGYFPGVVFLRNLESISGSLYGDSTKVDMVRLRALRFELFRCLFRQLDKSGIPTEERVIEIRASKSLEIVIVTLENKLESPVAAFMPRSFL